MSTKCLRRVAQHQSSYSLSCFPPRRSFLSFPGTEPQTLTATRILPYKSDDLCRLIADVDSYSEFVPYCINSRVTKRSSPAANGTIWPAQADLKVGWGGYEEIFTSRIFCEPGRVVEALSGEAITTIPRTKLAHYADTLHSPATANHIFNSLSTKWTFNPKPQKDAAQGQTEVNLTIDFQFANPLYTALSKAVAPKVAGVMIEAFEVRARNILGRVADAEVITQQKEASISEKY